jgi:hypothetical protein
MPVFRTHVLSEIDTALMRIADIFYTKTFLVLSPDEFTEAFIDPAHMGLLFEAQSLIGSVGSSASTTKIAPEGSAHTMNADVAFAGNPPVPIPMYVANGLQPTCPDDLRARITAWATDRARFGMAFGTARIALNYLNERCADTRAMALYFPCLPQLMAGVSEDEKNYIVRRAQKLAQKTSVPKLPRLEPALKKALHEASAIVQAAAMASSAPDIDLKRGHCRIKVTGAGKLEVPDVFSDFPTGGLFY